MSARYIDSGNLKLLEQSLNEFQKDEAVKSVIFLMAAKDAYSKKDIDPLLQNFSKPTIGGIFPELISNSTRKDTGVLLFPLDFELHTQLFDLNDNTDDLVQKLESSQKKSLEPSSTLFVFIDALSINKELFIEVLFNFFGLNPDYIGGGAGSLEFKPMNCIISNKGMVSNAAIIGWAHKKLAVGVAHGWEPVSAPLKVTKANRNELISINWKPAFEAYKEIVEPHSGMYFKNDNFFDIAKSYPLGIAKIDAEMVVRDPFAVKENALILVDKISEGEYVEVLNGNMNSLLDGASKAREIAFSKLEKNMNQNCVFCIDCISRVLYMQEDFNKELQAISKGSNVNGILSIGEIANSGESFLEIYNKTIVIALW